MFPGVEGYLCELCTAFFRSKKDQAVVEKRYPSISAFGIPESMGYTDKVRFVEFIKKCDRYTIFFVSES